MDSKSMYLSMGIREDVYAFGEKIWGALEERFKQIDQVSEYNQLKVIAAMQKKSGERGLSAWYNGLWL